MATLEKPKKEKSKKSRNRVPIEKEEEEPAELSTSEEQRPAENVSLLEEFERVATLASSSSGEAIISHECCISSDVGVTSQEPEGTQEPTETEAQPSAPSAPPSTTVHVVQYPNLQPMQLSNAQVEEHSAKIVYRQAESPTGFALARSHIKLLSTEELRQIYDCPELELAKQFELEFLMNSLLETSEADPLYAAVMEYYELQGKITSNLHDVEKLRKGCAESQKQIWVRQPVTRTFSGTCGDGNVVQECVTYDVIQVDPIKLEVAKTSLTGLYDLVCHAYTNNSITAKITKVKVDQIINDLLTYPNLDGHSVVSLHHTQSGEALQCVSQLRRAISILFSFVRRPSPNANFDKDLKEWLRKLIALQLLLATREDHWFLLFNILRCPNGVGSWAAQFLQLPGTRAVRRGSQQNELPLDLNSPELNHCMAVLQILLMPVKKRNEYLKSQAQAHRELSDTPGATDRWIVVDSDGEDSHTPAGECVGLKESDLVALLNQMPFEKIFTSALRIEKFLDDYIIEPDMITAQQMLAVVVFFSQLVKTIGEGLLTYNNERYKQLAKRLGRLVRHTLQYVFDYNELFINNNLYKSSEMYERIQVELQALLVRACGYIYRTRNLGTWQYFSTLPFGTLDAEVIWHLFYYLNVGFPTDLANDLVSNAEAAFQAEDFWRKFDLANADVAPEDMYYLLQTFFEMANERNRSKDGSLVKAICLHIFHIGYIHKSTREICYKTARDMLANLMDEDLFGCVLVQLKMRYGEVDQAAYLFKALPLENWHPSMDTFEVLSNWLLHFDYQSSESQLARLIISHLNWGLDCEGRLFLPHNIHVRMAHLVNEALNKYAPEVIGASGISESVRQVSSLIDSTQSSREQFTNWCWRMVSVLRLHLMDQGVESVRRTLQHPTEPLLFIPELERMEMIFQGVNENRPLALYVGMLVSLHGHSIPLICQHGFILLQQLLLDHRHAATIRCLELIVPLFLETPETLANCESFQRLITTLLNADRTYLKLAKDMVYANSIGPILELLDNMLHHQIISYTSYGLCSPLNLLNIWLNCFTTLPGWSQNSNLLYLLDRMLRISYQFPDCRAQAVEFFYNYYKDCTEWKSAPKGSALKAFFGGQSVSRIPLISPQNCWLNLVILEIEFRLVDTRIFPELLRQISAQPVEAALKKTISLSKTSAFPASQLVIFKYAQLLASMESTHALFPIVCQKFFELYLWRVPTENESLNFSHNFGVSDKFYEYNVPLMKSIKSQLKSAESYYSALATKNANDDAMAHFYRNCCKLMQNCALWLEDTQINRFTSDAEHLPAQYNSEKLRELLSGHVNHWTEFLCLASLRKEQRHQADQWGRKVMRLSNQKAPRTPVQPKQRQPPAQHIKSLLKSYEKIVENPLHIRVEPIKTPPIDGVIVAQIQKKMTTLNSTANNYHYKTSELNSLDLNYLERVPTLYSMIPYEETRRKECTSLLFKRNCTAPAQIKLTPEHIRINDVISRKQAQNRERHDKIIEDILLAMSVESFAQAIEELGVCIGALLVAPLESSVTQIGVRVFYDIVDNLNEVTMKFQPTHDLYFQVLEKLGVFLEADQAAQGLAILRLALKRPDLLELLAGVFVPSRTDVDHFLSMYEFLIDSHLKHCDTQTLFVLFSKFDLLGWMEAYQPKLSEINRLLLLVLQGLEAWSQPDSSLLQDLFRRHLVHIFGYDFPQHYGEVMQLVLDRTSDQKLMPVVLLDLLNALFVRSNCAELSLQQSEVRVHELALDFARRQKLFTLKAATDTLLLLSRHFQKERLHHGLHGLYPKHKDYCQALVLWFTSFGHTLLASAICSYQELLADQISDIVFGSIVETYSPWLIPYTEETVSGVAHWIRQLTPGQSKVLLPWSEQHVSSCKLMIRSFVATIIQVLQYLPSSNKILEHVFAWYVHHFAQSSTTGHVLAPIHEGLAQLPWERFLPPAQHVELLYDSLQKFLPESHAMLGHIFIRIEWNNWFAQMPQPVSILSRLFTIFVKIAFEPNIHIHPNTSKILEDAIRYPWHLVECSELEQLLKWFVASVEPAIALKIPAESNYADRAVLELLRLACAMLPERSAQDAVVLGTAKRMLYTRSMVRMQRACGAKHQKLLATKEGERAFSNAFLELLDSIDGAISSCSEHRTMEEQRREALNLMLELVAPTQTQSQEVSNIHIKALVWWQQRCSPGNLVMCSTLPAIGHLNTYIASIYSLLEASIENYFRTSPEIASWHAPSWQGLMEALSMSLPKLDLMPIMQGSYFFSLHVFVLYKMEEIATDGDKVTFLQDLSQLLENLKTSPQTEPRMALVWGVIIARGCQIAQVNQQVKKPLHMLARHLQIASTKAEGWGDGLLGVIGLKSEVITNRRKVLTRCLACVIFSLFPANRDLRIPSEEYESALRELSMLLANKKFTDIKPLIVRAVSLLKESTFPDIRAVPHMVCRLISIFYEESYLTTIPEVWDFEFKLMAT
uniref:Ectopic P granules protein 5 homolog n=1 Tax=Drosophila melanogaster TaxID=7227 RepID=EPG5_DROME|nr:ectopic P-granules autophagy protein 5, isoform C [Drosophila melanogaster]Q9VE34.2 RecName: Full=Ectopic P granules protein 5 homolog [Drosophila melanogaster]AAF55595.2 ectopic P-granules autophagy protein 5, isoform C [Drosophila melanogaster]|eukprot:NP_650752.2 ectopic P-granules autophagy protein 5, isoform C [Drosophila melanogaster]